MSISDTVKLEASGEVNDEFPDALREPILRRVQFSQVPRIDHLGQWLCFNYTMQVIDSRHSR